MRVNQDVTYTATWTYSTLTITKNNSAAGTVTSYKDTKVTAGEQITLVATTNEGYTFVGWYKGEEELSKNLIFEYTMTKETVTIEARWCKVTLKSANASAGSVGGLDSTYKVGDKVTITATANKGYTFVG